jgi:hypothetical protein
MIMRSRQGVSISSSCLICTIPYNDSILHVAYLYTSHIAATGIKILYAAASINPKLRENFMSIYKL